MNQSELILKTYKELTLKLNKPYYVLEAIPASAGSNQILYSSPALKEILGLTQYELSSDPEKFFNAIHPDFIGEYIESNKRLLHGTQKEKRIYLVKNKETGEFVPVEELASSRLNKARNCYEIYCSLRSINGSMDINDETDIEMISNAFNKLKNLTPTNRVKLFETTQHFADSMMNHFKMNACRVYGFNMANTELSIFVDTQNKLAKQVMESTTRIKTRAMVPKHSEDSLLFKLLLGKENVILENKKDILQVLKDHSENALIKKFASTALRIYKLKSFGVLPILCPDGRTVGLVTFGSAKQYTEEEKKEIYDYTTTNSFVFCNLLGEACNS